MTTTYRSESWPALLHNSCDSSAPSNIFFQQLSWNLDIKMVHGIPDFITQVSKAVCLLDYLVKFYSLTSKHSSQYFNDNTFAVKCCKSFWEHLLWCKSYHKHFSSEFKGGQIKRKQGRDIGAASSGNKQKKLGLQKEIKYLLLQLWNSCVTCLTKQ